MEQINQIVILDNGAHTIKVGFYNDPNPKYVFFFINFEINHFFELQIG